MQPLGSIVGRHRLGTLDIDGIYYGALVTPYRRGTIQLQRRTYGHRPRHHLLPPRVAFGTMGVVGYHHNRLRSGSNECMDTPLLDCLAHRPVLRHHVANASAKAKIR